MKEKTEVKWKMHNGRYLNLFDVPIVDNTDIPDYEDYVEWCEDMDEEVYPDNSDQYWNWVYDCRETDWEDLWYSLKSSELNKETILVTGQLGLWNGRPTIVPQVFNGICEAIQKCLNDMDYYRIFLQKDGSLEVQGIHHDGTNIFYLHRLNKKGLAAVEAADNRYEDYEPKNWWFKRFWIEEVTP